MRVRLLAGIRRSSVAICRIYPDVTLATGLVVALVDRLPISPVNVTIHTHTLGWWINKQETSVCVKHASIHVSLWYSTLTVIVQWV